MLDVDIRRRAGAFLLDARFQAPTAGVTALFGASGAGKTTILAAIAGLARPDSGRISIDDEAFFDSDAGVDVAPEARGLGFVFQDLRLFPHLSVEANLRYGLARSRRRPERVSFDDVVTLLGLAPHLERRPHTLSGGEKQRVAIGRALLCQPRLLLLDEPLASLDEDRRAEVLGYLEVFREGFAVPMVYVSHSMDEVARLADTLVVIERGSVVAAGPLLELLVRLDLDVLAERADAAAVIETIVEGHNYEAFTTRLAFRGGALAVARTRREAGNRLRVRIAARDVAVALERPTSASFQNVLPATIEGVRERARGDVLLCLSVGRTRILSAVTRAAVASLGLREGRRVYALVKSVAVVA